MPLYQQVIRTFPNLKPLSASEELMRPLASAAETFNPAAAVNSIFGANRLGLVQREARKQAPQYAKASFNTPAVLDSFLGKLPFKKTDSVLDAGSASGALSFHIAGQVQQVLALDISRHMLEEGKKVQLEKKIDNVLFHRANFNEIPVADGKFDVVVSRLNLHTSLNPVAHVQELTRVLKPGGVLALIDFTAVGQDPSIKKRMVELFSLLDRSAVHIHSKESIAKIFGLNNLEILPEFSHTAEVATPVSELLGVYKPNWREGQIFSNAVTSNFNYPLEDQQDTGFNPYELDGELVASPAHTLFVGRKSL
mmetsp:Transcript_31639/g.51066  ORF Transcript_31639/g.51066 Transcript_31639/m.51066 type:complete len:309 (+) Transcript_31639:24-950(+)